ncbi:MAG: hypothetical protein FWD73_10730 [Polyangiaceae bacterium]|nr:hypothetical protein [Polyangiaceae bacterium]
MSKTPVSKKPGTSTVTESDSDREPLGRVGRFGELEPVRDDDAEVAFAATELKAISDELKALRLGLLGEGASAVRAELPLAIARLSDRARRASEVARDKVRSRGN